MMSIGVRDAAGSEDRVGLRPTAGALSTCNGRAALPDGVLTAVAARLDDKNSYVRSAAVKILGWRAALPDGVLTAVAARLDHEANYVRRFAAEILIHRQDKIPRRLLKRSFVRSLHKTLLERSFEEQLSWYIEADSSRVNMPDGIEELSIDNQQNEVRKWINGGRPVDCPSYSASYSTWEISSSK